LDVSKVDRVLHLSSSHSAASSLPALARHPYDAVAGSFRIRGVARPTPLVARTSCNCFRGTLQAYVSSVSEVCFICVFRTHVARVFIWMLHMFQTYVACVFIWMLCMVAMVFKCSQTFFSSVS
jgi:hypothetical protein